MHIRRAILEDLRAQLDVIPDISGVWIQRVSPSRNTFPCITLYSENDSSEKVGFTLAPLCYERDLTVQVVGWVAGTRDDEEVEIRMDEMSSLIEQALTIPANANILNLTNTSFLVDEDEPDVHAVTLTYSIIYDSIENAPEI